ncbi:hypothetical protein NW870_10615 [Synechococcus sp. R50.1]
MNRVLSCCCAPANRCWLCLPKRLVASGFVTLVLLLAGAFDPVQAGNCPSNGNRDESLAFKVESVFGGQLDLSRYDGIQALILTNSQTRSQSEALSKSLALEFGRNPRLRQIVLVDGRGLLLVRNLVLQVIRESVPTDPRLVSPFVYVSVDFEGETIQKLQEIAAATLPGINFRQQAALLLLDGQGTLLSGFADLERSNLSIRRCIRTLIG